MFVIVNTLHSVSYPNVCSRGGKKIFFSFTHFRFFDWNSLIRLAKDGVTRKSKQKLINMCIAHVHVGAPSDEELKEMVRIWVYISS